jgi:hypothetical protein
MSDYGSEDDLFDGICTPPPSNQVRQQACKRKQPPDDDYGDFDDDLEEIAQIASSAKRPRIDSSPNEDEKAVNTLARGILAENFGYVSFRHEQEAAINATLKGDNALAIFPTGAGKSLCYQVRISWTSRSSTGELTQADPCHSI